MNYLKRLILSFIYNSIKISKNKNSIKLLGTVSFLESIIIPIPPDIFLIPIVLAKKKKWLYLGLLCTLFSVLGGIIGYIIGYFFWDVIGSSIVDFYNAHEQVEKLKIQFSKYGWFIILIAGFTPLPYKIFTLGSGLLSFNFLVFLICSFFSRGFRFIFLSYFTNKYGEKGISIVEKHFFKISSVFLILSLITFIYIIIK